MTEETNLFSFDYDVDTAEAPPLLPPGNYPAEISEAKIAVSKNNKPYLPLVLDIKAADFPPDFPSTKEKMTVKYNLLSLENTPEGAYRVRSFYESIGLKAPKRTINPAELLGRTCMVEIAHSEFPEGSGRWKLDVKNIKRLA